MNHINKKFKCNFHQGVELPSDSEDDIPLYEVDLRNPFAETLTLQEQAKRGRKKKTASYDTELPKVFRWMDEFEMTGITPDDILNNRATSAEVDYVLSEYLSKRYNLTAYREVTQ